MKGISVSYVVRINFIDAKVPISHRTDLDLDEAFTQERRVVGVQKNRGWNCGATGNASSSH
jgi:hypothetical protein